ncbi:MAG: hypothetical protein CAPSK01_001366 [Candidatus Accumulibacter vicinus]|uniref:Uncharacterized protein n=1 Tax=Candidatus Accumulibacter vicinus TaxID=2954382 RepID=A0A084Y380_9PROT|nr:MAG: hypothetical protein CAPSK01_001366 [Candidatus Accumulibacter vicinus]
MRQRVDATGKHQMRTSILNVDHRRVDRLHAAGAVAHHCPGRYLMAATQTQSDETADVDFIGRRTDTTKNDLIKVARQKRLADQQCASGLHCQIARRKRPGRIAPFEKRRSRAIDDIHGLESHGFSFCQIQKARNNCSAPSRAL